MKSFISFWQYAWRLLRCHSGRVHLVNCNYLPSSGWVIVIDSIYHFWGVTHISTILGLSNKLHSSDPHVQRTSRKIAYLCNVFIFRPGRRKRLGSFPTDKFSMFIVLQRSYQVISWCRTRLINATTCNGLLFKHLFPNSHLLKIRAITLGNHVHAVIHFNAHHMPGALYG